MGELEQLRERLEKVLAENRKLKLGYQAYEALERERDKLAKRVLYLQDGLEKLRGQDRDGDGC